MSRIRIGDGVLLMTSDTRESMNGRQRGSVDCACPGPRWDVTKHVKHERFRPKILRYREEVVAHTFRI